MIKQANYHTTLLFKYYFQKESDLAILSRPHSTYVEAHHAISNYKTIVAITMH